MSSSVTVTPDTIYEQLYQEALAICQLYSRLDSSIHYTATKIFAAPTDRRVKRGGHLFIAHLLRFAVLVQLSLFPDTEICDYARIAIPNILQFCKSRSQNGWPWCYDTTLKYFKLLVAAGVLIVRKREPGIYYLPLGPCVLLPDHARQQLAELATQRTKVSRSAAFRRAADHCLVSAWPERAEARTVIDERDARQAALAINAVLQRQQGVTLLPATLQEVMHVLAHYTPRVLKKSVGKSLNVLSLTSAIGPGNAGLLQPSSADGCVVQDGQQNLSTDSHGELDVIQESTDWHENLPKCEQIVDSACARFTESLISHKDSVLLSDITDFTIGGLRRSTCSAQFVDSATTAERHASSLSEEDIRSWAVRLSRDFEENDSRIGHYTACLRQSPEILHIAIVDALVRSHFPDPHCKPDKLGGGWVTKRYKAYLAGAEEVPPEIFAWSQTGLSYQDMRALLEEEARRQNAWGQARRRPFPDEVQEVIASSCLEDFWQDGASDGLQVKGYRYVEVNGELLPADHYQRLRRRAAQTLLKADTCELQPETEYELQTYIKWYQEQLYSREEVEHLLQEMSPTVRQKIMAQVGELEAALDLGRYNVEVVLLPIRRPIPIKKGLVIEVSNREEPARECWLLRSKREVEQFIADRCLSQQDCGARPLEEMQLPPSEVGPCDAGDEQEPGGDLCIGEYVVTFREMGALLAHGRDRVQYRVDAPTATNTIDFVRHHRQLVRAMAEGREDELPTVTRERRDDEN